MNRRKQVMIIKTNRMLLREAEIAAAVLVEGEIPSRAEAQKIQFNRWGHLSFIFKMFRYVGIGFLPYFGEKYIYNVYKKAEANAKAHEVENIKEKIESGKYQEVKIQGNVLQQLRQMSAPNKCIQLFMSRQ